MLASARMIMIRWWLNISESKQSAPLVTLKSVFEQLGVTHELPKKQVAGFLVAFVAAMTAHLQSGARVSMSGLGTLEVKQNAARTGRNPATGEPIQIKASKKVAFRAAKELKEAVWGQIRSWRQSGTWGGPSINLRVTARRSERRNLQPSDRLSSQASGRIYCDRSI
jgi:DNA-binding protein HU-beta